jgi:hypothetical protein
MDIWLHVSVRDRDRGRDSSRVAGAGGACLEETLKIGRMGSEWLASEF